MPFLQALALRCTGTVPAPGRFLCCWRKGRGGTGLQARLDLGFAVGDVRCGVQVTEVDGDWREGFCPHPAFTAGPGDGHRQLQACVSQNPLEPSEGPGSVGGAQITNPRSQE